MFMDENFKEKNDEAIRDEASDKVRVFRTPESEPELTDEEKYAKKYLFIKDKLLTNYEKGRKKYIKGKIITAVVFTILSIVLAALGIATGRHMQMLAIWIFLIFFLVTVFLFVDYMKYLVEDKVIPYLKDDDMLEYGEYDIFNDNDEEDEEDDEEDE